LFVSRIRIFRQQVPAQLILIAVLEYLVMLGAVLVAYALRFSVDLDDWDGLDDVLGRAHIYALVNLLCIMAMGAYRPLGREGLTGSLLRTMVAIFLIGTVVLSFGFYLFPTLELYLGRGVLAIAGLLSMIGIALLRLFFQRVTDLSAMRRRVLVVGAGMRAQRLLVVMGGLRNSDVELVGCYPVQRQTEVEHKVPVECLMEADKSIYETCRALDIRDIVVAVDERRRSDNSGGFPLDELLDCKLSGISVHDDTSFLEQETGRLDIRSVSPGWLVFSQGFSFSPLRDYLERGFDVLASATLLLLTWPLMLVAAVMIKLEDGLSAPVFYSQERVGYGGRIFRVHKFRSMTVNAEKDGKAVWAQKGDSRVTRVGAFIRNTRIDELPQIFNVLKGEMSFVGPRPERPQFVEELAQQIPYYRERHRVKPGITGWAQLCYPYGASVEDAEEKLKYDLYYIKNHSVFFDLFILVRTVEVILLGTGVR
jgi:sugar transferase (PEP-CTERM system associated)